MANKGDSPETRIKTRNSIFYGWIVLSVAFIILVLGYAIRNTFSVFYPAIVEEFGWGRGNTALMFSITMVVYGLLAPVSGSLVDRFGPRIILPVGAFILGGGVALCSMATAQWHFYLFYGIMVAAGLSLTGWTPLTAIVSNWFVRKRGFAFGILAAGFGGSLVFATIAQFLISTFGWQIAYMIIGAASVVIIVPLCTLLIRNHPRDRGLLPDGVQFSEVEPKISNEPVISTSVKDTWALTPWTLSKAIKTYQFWLLFFTAFCLLGLAETIAIAHMVFFFRDIGHEAMRAASMYSVFGVAFVVGNLFSFLSDRLGRERVFLPSCLLSAVAVSFLFLIKDTSHPWLGLLYAVFFGLGIGTAAPVFFTTVADLFQGKHFGSIQGAVVLGFSLGGAIAPWLAGFLHDRTGSYFSTFLILLCSLLICLLLMWLVAPRKIRPVSS